MDLSPGLHQPVLSSRKLPTYAFDRIQRKRRQGILIQRVEVWTMVRGTNFRKHTDDDSEESGNLWHPVRFTRCSVRGLTSGVEPRRTSVSSAPTAPTPCWAAASLGPAGVWPVLAAASTGMTPWA